MRGIPKTCRDASPTFRNVSGCANYTLIDCYGTRFGHRKISGHCGRCGGCGTACAGSRSMRSAHAEGARRDERAWPTGSAISAGHRGRPSYGPFWRGNGTLISWRRCGTAASRPVRKIARSLEGNWQEDLLFELRQAVAGPVDYSWQCRQYHRTAGSGLRRGAGPEEKAAKQKTQPERAEVVRSGGGVDSGARRGRNQNRRR